ncbi:MAG: glycosyltransferase family 2 protein, partial [Candidatus Omnitrophota bacterium]
MHFVKISVVVPTYNRRERLKRALLSVFAQTSLPTEVTVIDDGSTDETGAMIRKDFPQVNYCYQENSGVSAARNIGIQQSTGDWLAFLDSDDEWLPEKLANQKAL